MKYPDIDYMYEALEELKSAINSSCVARLYDPRGDSLMGPKRVPGDNVVREDYDRLTAAASKIEELISRLVDSLDDRVQRNGW